ncbi:MAG: helix-hairpin-helix domain-containing protein [Gemmatimonadota bacterium]|nr:helix-hairpin-helix domain-containing protein [Gemmatimonadota bacterium]
MDIGTLARTSLALVVITGVACGGGGEDAAEESPTESASTASAPAGSLLNPNLASADELSGVPGMTPEAVQAIVDGRPFLTAAAFNQTLSAQIGDAARGAFESVWLPINLNDVTEEEILLIPGMDARMAHEFEEYRPYSGMDEFRREIGKYVDGEEVARLARYVYVPIDLNTASREEIMAVPGMDERMAHEFEEYRPYTSMDQFRQEIGKYVDQDEVARFERYVTIN